MGCKCSQIKPLPSSEHQAMRLHEKCLAKEEKSLFQTSETHETEDTLGDSRIETLECFKASLTRAHYETMDEEDREALEARVEDYTFPFENLVFEGGGVKGLAFVGAIKCLEELGIRQQIRRFAGTSVGSIAAAMVAMGYHYDELEEFWSGDVESFFSDHSCGYLSFLPNIISKFGWNPGKKIMEYMGRKIAAKSRNKDPDMTFYDLYREMKVELCIVVTNVNQMSTIYCHPKTTPDMSIRKACACPSQSQVCSQHRGITTTERMMSLLMEAHSATTLYTALMVGFYPWQEKTHSCTTSSP
ncbi:hypothetical protein EGW08_010825 [Elysia chlorotica]|uniref:PNPLA domain-containing protein n=1 Tax=Elysia chlorotica TaxID=188477 RepID=A0A3S1B728_ELYCH|nr:hypothetical protein EGW08_010825 [Elysia chlorotica]